MELMLNEKNKIFILKNNFEFSKIIEKHHLTINLYKNICKKMFIIKTQVVLSLCCILHFCYSINEKDNIITFIMRIVTTIFF